MKRRLILACWNRDPKSLRKAGLAQFTTSASTPVSSSKPLSSNILQYIRHSVHPNKRRASDVPGGAGSNKRQRSGDNENENNDDPVVIDDNTPIPPFYKDTPLNGREEDEELDPITIVSWFRLDTGTLGYIHCFLLWRHRTDLFCSRQKEYQILYFSLEEPLDEQAQTARKVVSATRICWFWFLDLVCRIHFRCDHVTCRIRLGKFIILFYSSFKKPCLWCRLASHRHFCIPKIELPISVFFLIPLVKSLVLAI